MLPSLRYWRLSCSFRFAVIADINVRFRLLTLSTFTATLIEVASTLLIDGWSSNKNLNLAVRTIYYVAINFNAYHLMRYVQAYVKVQNPKFDAWNRILLASSFLILILNLLPGIEGFFFIVPDDGGLVRGNYNTLWSSVYVFYFRVIVGWLQITNRQFYYAKSQFIVMRTRNATIKAVVVVQYMLFRKHILIV